MDLSHSWPDNSLSLSNHYKYSVSGHSRCSFLTVSVEFRQSYLVTCAYLLTSECNEWNYIIKQTLSNGHFFPGIKSWYFFLSIYVSIQRRPVNFHLQRLSIVSVYICAYFWHRFWITSNSCESIVFHEGPSTLTNRLKSIYIWLGLLFGGKKMREDSGSLAKL